MTGSSGGTVFALVGAQWGSEGKGVIAAAIAHRFAAAVRVGGPNAGHSLYHRGVLYKMRSVPCLWVNEGARLFIGAGAVVNAGLLERELASLPFPVSITIDPVAVLITEEHEHTEARVIRASIGSTAEGVGEARVSRIRRAGGVELAGDHKWSGAVTVAGVASLIDGIVTDGGVVMLEGTQGSGLSLFHGTEYPFATSADTNASGLASEAGVAPSVVGHVQLVMRTFPIRVAGNSGPMGDELTWGYFIDRGVVDQPEQTTVTRKTRRIAEFRPDEIDVAMRLNKPCGVWLTFGDYLDVSMRGGASVRGSGPIMDFVSYVEAEWGVPVLGVGTGPTGSDFAVARLRDECLHGREW